MLGDRFQDGNEILIISYKASPYFSQLFNATDGRRASKPSTHNTFSFRPRTSLELQENVFLRFYFSKDIDANKWFLLFHFSMPESFLLSSSIDHLLFFFRSLVFTTVPALIPNYYIVFRRIKSVLKQFENATTLHNIKSH